MQEPVNSSELFDMLWDEPRMPEIIRPQQFVSNPKKNPYNEIPYSGSTRDAKAIFLPADGIDKQALATKK